MSLFSKSFYHKWSFNYFKHNLLLKIKVRRKEKKIKNKLKVVFRVDWIVGKITANNITITPFLKSVSQFDRQRWVVAHFVSIAATSITAVVSVISTSSSTSISTRISTSSSSRDSTMMKSSTSCSPGVGVGSTEDPLKPTSIPRLAWDTE